MVDGTRARRAMMWLRPLAWPAICLLLMSCASANVAAPAAVVRLRVAGSTSMEVLLRDLSEGFQETRAGVVVDVQATGSTMGLDELQAGSVDLAAVSWHPRGMVLPAGLQAFPVARDALALVVNPRNDVKRMTLLQVKGIYEGEILDWQGLGGQAQEPLVISREEGSGTRAAFEAMVMGSERVTLNALVMPSSEAVVDYVGNHPAAIGYVSTALLTPSVRPLEIEGVVPSAESIRNNSYHLTRILYLVGPSSPSPAARAFLDFAASAAGQSLVSHHYVAIR